MAATAGSATVTLSEGYQRCYLQISSFTSTTNMDVYASIDNGTTYYQLRHMQVATASSQSPSFIIASTAMVNGSIVPIPPGFLNYKVVCIDSIPTAAIVFTLLGNT
jgi:hypothetical protein